MSVLVLQLGQCGNQLGEILWSTLHESCAHKEQGHDWHGPTPHYGPMFASDGFARCVLVDAEPKVARGVLIRNPKLFRPCNVVVGESGRGNSWVCGYCGVEAAPSKKSPNTKEKSPKDKAKHPAPFHIEGRDQRLSDSSLLARALLCVRNEMSRAEDGAIEGIIVLHSLAGGTGSGLGSALLENLRYHFCDELSEEVKPVPPSILPAEEWEHGAYSTRRKCLYLISVCVAPRLGGETVVQSYNSTLSLSVLQRVCNAVVLLRNDQSKVVQTKSDPRPFFPTNFEFASWIAALLQGGQVYGAVGDLVARLCANPAYKFLTLMPLKVVSPSLLEQFRRFSVTAALICSNADAEEPSIIGKFQSTSNFVIQHKEKNLPTMLCLNQGAELSKNLVLPILLDCHRKTKAGAFLHTFIAQEDVLKTVRSYLMSIDLGFVRVQRHAESSTVMEDVLELSLKHVAATFACYPNTL